MPGIGFFPKCQNVLPKCENHTTGEFIPRRSILPVSSSLGLKVMAIGPLESAKMLDGNVQESKCKDTCHLGHSPRGTGVQGSDSSHIINVPEQNS